MAEQHALRPWHRAAFALDLAALQRAAEAGDVLARQLCRAEADTLVLDWIGRAPQPMLLVASGARRAPPQAPLQPVLAWGDTPDANDTARGAGLPIIDAGFTLSSAGGWDTLILIAGAYIAPAPDAPATLVEGEQLQLRFPTLDPGRLAGATGAPMPLAPWALAAVAPDPVDPVHGVLRAPQRWPVDVTAQAVDAAGIRCRWQPARYPAVADWLVVDGQGDCPAVEAAAATVDTLPTPATILRPTGPLQPASGPDSVFGPPRFVFDDVEVIGFRIDLSGRFEGDAQRAREALQPLIRGLNFHLDEAWATRGAPADFEYEVATPVVVLELLRYGGMRAAAPQLPLGPDDAMPQHELLMRLLVGRVDDDSDQARDAAAHMPAIYVDNPWSRAAGRLALGYPKQLAWVAAGRDGPVLDSCGRPRANPGDAAVPLATVGRVGLQRRAGAAPSPADTLLTLEYPGVRFDENFLPFDLDWLGGARGVWPGWHPDDFGGRRFGGGRVARQAAAGNYARLGVVQVTPQDGQPLPRAWVGASTSLDGLLTQFPRGIASLTLHRAGLPETDPWTQLIRLLGSAEDERVSVGLPTGDWYRLRCGMDYRARSR